MVQATFPRCPDCVLFFLVLTEVTIEETLVTEKWLFEQQMTLEQVVKKGLKKVCKIKKVLFFFFFGVSLRRFSSFSSHLSILSFYWILLENFPLFYYELMKCLIKNQDKVFLIPFYLTS